MKFFSVLAVALFVALVCEASETGTCGEGCTWEYDDGKLKISGGVMTNYSWKEEAPWNIKKDKITQVTIKNCVIGEEAFKQCKELQSVKTEGVTSIPRYAFSYGFPKLTTVQFDDSLESIKAYAFESCTALETITIPASVSEIHDSSFRLCTGLKNFVVADGSTYFKAVNGILYDAGVTVLHIVPPQNDVVNFVIPDTVEEIRTYAMQGCNKLESVTIPASVVGGISTSCFYNCFKLKEFVVKGGSFLEVSDGALIKKSLLGNSVLKYPPNRDAETFTVPDDVTVIDLYAFQGASKLKNINIHNNVATIGADCFTGCSSWEVVNLSATVTVGANAFDGCTGVKEFNVAEGNAKLKSVDGVLYSTENGKKYLVKYPSQKEELEYTLPSDTLYIKKFAFEECAHLSTITIEKLEDTTLNMFYNCKNLSTINYNGDKKLGSSAVISGCSKLTRICVTPEYLKNNKDKTLWGLKAVDCGADAASMVIPSFFAIVAAVVMAVFNRFF